MEDFKFLAKRHYDAARRTRPAPGGEYPDLINLSIGDPDVATPKVIIEEAFRDAMAGHTKYTDVRGYPRLREAIAKFYLERYNMKIDDGQIFVSTAGNVAMFLTMQAILDPGDEVIILRPYFFPYPGQVKMAGGVPVFVNTKAEEGFRIDFDRLERRVTDKTKAIIINNPNNPTGVCYERKVLEKLADFVIRHDIMVAADDIYTSFVYNGEFVPICSLPGMARRTVTVNSFSKNFIMTGFRIGNIIAPDYIIRAIRDINEHVVYTAPSISQRAALHGLEHFEEFEKDIVDVFRERVEYSYERLSKIPYVDISPVQGTFYIFPDISKSGLTSVQFSDLLYKKCHIRVIPGVAFGESGEYHIRISCTLGLDKLKEAFDRMEKLTF